MAALSPFAQPLAMTKAPVNGRLEPVRQPRWQSISKSFIPTLTSVTQSLVPTTLFSNTTKYRVTVPRGSVDKVGAVTLRAGITIATAPVQLAPTPLWLDRAVIPGVKDPHATLYGDVLLTNLLAATSGQQWPCVSKTVNMMGENETVTLGPTPLLQPGTYYYNIPLVGSFFQFLDYYMGNGDDLLIDLFPAGNIIASGAGTVSLSSLTVLIEGWQVFGKDAKALMAKLLSQPAVTRYVDPIQMVKSNVTLTAGAANTFDLNQIRGHASHCALFVRSQGSSNTGSGMMKILNLGDHNGATFDIQTASSTSLLGNGTPVPLSYNRFEYWCKNFPSSFACDKPLYVIPLSNNVPMAYRGVMDGYLELNGDSKKFVLNLPAAPTSEVQTFTASGVAASGYYRFSFKGELSAALAFDATAAAMKTAFEAMRTVQAKSITVTFSGPATATFTATFSHPETAGLDELVQLIPSGLATGAAAPVDIPTTLTTKGTTGIATGAYDVYFYFWCWRQISSHNGRLESYAL